MPMRQISLISTATTRRHRLARTRTVGPQRCPLVVLHLRTPPLPRSNLYPLLALSFPLALPLEYRSSTTQSLWRLRLNRSYSIPSLAYAPSIYKMARNSLSALLDHKSYKCS